MKNENNQNNLYKNEEMIEIMNLLDQEQTKEVDVRLHELQKIQLDREIRIIENRVTKEDIESGFTLENFSWLAKFAL